MSKNKKETSIEYYAIAYYRLSKDDRGKKLMKHTTTDIPEQTLNVRDFVL